MDSQKRFILLLVFLALVIYTYGCILMIQITGQYIPIHPDVAFLSIKQDYSHLKHYQIAFFTHVFSAILVLLAGYTQFFSRIRLRSPKIHRVMGWVYVMVTLLFAGPSGFILGIYANGGLSSRIAFCLLAVIWIVFTAMAVLRIIQKNIHSHRAWMIRSFALALSALTLRAWKYCLVVMFHPKPMDVYQVVAWLGWTLNLLVAELIILYSLNTLNHVSFLSKIVYPKKQPS